MRISASASRKRVISVGIVDSTTFEEAICEPGSWIKQRSRWIKGYMQTFLVHTRRPLQFLRSAGLVGFLGFIFFIGGTVLSGLINPLFWALYLIWLILATSGFDPVFPHRAAVSQPVQSAGRQWRAHVSADAGADPARLAQSHSL